MENMFTLKPSVKEKISTAFNRSKEGSLSDFYKLLETRFSTGKDTDIENVIKETMYKEGLFKTFEEYIKVNVEKAYEKKDTRVNAITTVQEYIDKQDWRINANANIGYSNAGMISNISGKLIANYWLDSVYSEEEGQAHRNGDYYIHDLDCLTGYCAGWSLRALLNEGFNGVKGKVASSAPNHLRTALGQMANFMGILQGEWAGAQAFSSFDTYLSPYVFKDNLSFNEVKKSVRSFIYNLNVPSRWAQSPFTNVTLDFTVPKDLRDQIPTRNDKHLFSGINNEDLVKRAKERGVNSPLDLTYKHFQKEIEMIDIAYYEVMTEGDDAGQPFTFPIPTVNITEDFDWNTPAANALFENTAKIGSSYFQNFIGSQYIRNEKGELVENPEAYKPNAVRSMCPLTSDTLLFVKDDNKISIITIKDLIKKLKDTTNAKYQVYTPNGWKNCQPVSVEKTSVLRVTLLNETYVDMGINHLQPILEDNNKIKSIPANELREGMLLPLYKSEIHDNELEPLFKQDYNKNCCKTDSNFNYCSIKSIKTLQYSEDLYCLEVSDDSHLFLLANGIFTHNCRLQLDLRQLLKRGNGLFGSAEMTGSIGVVTINMARLGYLCKDNKEALLFRLEHLMQLAKSTLEKKRAFVQEMYERGLYPYTKRYLSIGFRNHFSTIGVNGMNEMIRNFTHDQYDITSDFGKNFALEILDFIRNKLKVFQEETGNMYNLEATPAEGCCYRFAKVDKKLYPDIIQAGFDEHIYYTNSSQVPSNLTDDPFEALDLQNDLQCKYTGGTVLHLYMSERLPDGESAKKLVRKVLTNYKLPYVTITPVFSVCETHGYLNGQQEECPHCHKKTQVWTRVMGYHRPMDSFNIGKKGEHMERMLFSYKKC